MAGEGGAITVGAVAVDIVPSAKNFLAKLLKEVGPDVAKVAQTAGESIEKEIADGAADGIEKGLKDGKKNAAKEGADAGKKFASGFAEQLKGIAERASAAISIRADLDSDSVYREAAEIKAALDRVVAEIDVGLDDAEVYARMAILERSLDRATRRRSVNISVSKDVASAGDALKSVADGTERAALAARTGTSAFGEMAKSIGAVTPAGAVAQATVVGFIVALPALIAIVNTALLGTLGLLTALGAMAGVAMLGIGVAVLAFTKVSEAIKEVEDAEKKAAQTAAQAAQTAFSNQVALASANQAVASAEKQLARARASSTRSVTQAARSLVGAQRNLTNANAKEKDARKALSEAYVEAKNDLKALNEEIRKNRIEQQAAIANIHQAREAYNAVLADPTASQSDIQAAQAEYNTREQNLRDLRVEQAKNEAERARYNQFGLEANDKVIAAQASLKSAIESVRDAQESVTTASENSAAAQIDSANAVNDAEEALAQARQNRANTLKQQQLAAAVTTAGESADMTAFNELTATGKQFVTFYKENIKPVLDEFFAAAQDSGILSGLIGFFSALRPLFAPLKGLIKIVGHQMGVFLIQIGNFLAGAEGQKFIKWLGDMVKQLGPVMASLAKSGLSILITLLMSLTPVIEELAPTIAELAENFAVMFAEFVKSPDFQLFLQELIKNAPTLMELVLKLAFALIKMVVAIAPFTDQIIALMIKALDFFNALPIEGIVMMAEKLAVVGLLLSTITAAILGVGIAIVALVVLAAAWIAKWTSSWRIGWDDIKGIFWSVVDAIRDRAEEWATALRDRFDSLVDGIRDVWGRLRGALQTPIRAAIVFVNDYLIKGFNDISGWVNGPEIDPITVPAVTAARGTIVPGYQSSFRDEVPAVLRRGEGVLVPEVVRALGPATILEWNRRANLGQRIQLFATGGIATTPKSEFSGGTPKATGLAAAGLALLRAILEPLLDGFTAKFGDSKIVELIAAVPIALIEQVVPRLVEGATDIGGHVVSGVKKAGDWLDDVLPFDSGGYLPPGLSTVYNGTGRSERVMTHEQEQEMLRERALLRGGADINVRVHDGKVVGLISAELDRTFGSLADDFVYGGV